MNNKGKSRRGGYVLILLGAGLAVLFWISRGQIVIGPSQTTPATPLFTSGVRPSIRSPSVPVNESK